MPEAAPRSSASPPAGRPPRVREVMPGEPLGPFIDVARRVNARDPVWVQPLRRDVRTLLDRTKHPFHEHADVSYFLAERGGDAVGRIAAIVNHRYNEHHGERTGFFGFFETVHDPAVAGALLETVEGWLRERGMERVLGPMSFSTNEECGLLVENFVDPPALMMPHNPPYYGGLVEGAGYGKAKDLVAYWIGSPEIPDRLEAGVDRLMERAGVILRSMDMDRFEAEVGIIEEVYNAAWESNWGFVPMTEAEFAFMARELEPVVDPDLCVIAEADGEPVGFSLALPDFNRALATIDGRLFPFGFVRVLWERRKIHTVRLITLGTVPGYRRRGVAAGMILRTYRQGVPKGYDRCEASWILEDNREMRQALDKMGARVYKTYRIYGKDL